MRRLETYNDANTTGRDENIDFDLNEDEVGNWDCVVILDTNKIIFDLKQITILFFSYHPHPNNKRFWKAISRDSFKFIVPKTVINHMCISKSC